MAITVKHSKVSAIPDGEDTSVVRPSDWNADHTLSGTVPVANGGTGASTLTGYVKGNGTSAMTAATTIPNTDVTGLGTASTRDAGVANGVATLDSSGQVPLSQIPALGDLNYQGTWNATTNSPTLTSSVGTKGFYYVVSVAGTTNLNGISDWQIGDWAVFNGSIWQKIDNTDAVTSVNGQTGTVVLTASSVGAVSSVAATVPSFLSVSGSPITSSGTLAISYSGTALPVANGGTGVTASSGANSVVLRDSNQNITANSISEGFSNVAATGTTTVLTVASVPNYVVTGSGGQTYQLPDATTLTSGVNYTFNNNQSSGTIVVKNNSSTTVATIQSGGYVDVILLSNATAAGSWDVHNFAPSNVSWSTNTLDYAGSITNATWNGNAVAYNRGGTGQSSAFTAGGIVYGSTTSALAVTSIGTAGQVLTSAGAGTPTWTTPTTGTVTSVTGTAPVVSSGGNTPAISMAAATGSVNGYLTSTDWTTFNNKGSGTVTAVSVASANGFAGTSSGGATPALTLTTSITGVLKGNATAISAATSGTDYSAGTSALGTGILKSTTTTGALTIAVAADFPTLNQNTTGSAATLTTPRAIYGNNFDGSAALTQIIASTYGGTGNGFTKFSGATTAEKTYTLPDASATLLYSGGPLGTPSSGTVTNLTGTASININGTVGATTPAAGTFTTATANSFIPNLSTVPTNGMYLPAANSVGFATNTTEGMRIDSSGNFIVGDTTNYGVRSLIAGVGAATSTGGGSNNIVLALRDTTAGAAGVGAGIAFLGNDGTNTGVTFGTINATKEVATSGNYASSLIFKTRAAGASLVENMRLDSNGSLSITGTGKFGTTVGVGAATPSASGSGITFPATQSNSSNVNTLDDYEEGTYTPADNSGASLVFTGVSGSYTKVGRLVYFVFQLTYPTTVSVSVAVITLPFSIFVSGSASIGYTDYIAANQLYAGVSTGRTGVRFLNVGTELTNANLSGKTFIVSGTYQTDT